MREPAAGGVSYRDIIFGVDDPVATITLNRPKALNAWTGRMGSEVRHAVATAEADPAVVGIVITGAGRAFCAGADLDVLGGLADVDDFTDRSADAADLTVPSGPDTPADLAGQYTYLMACSKPIVAAINGAWAGMAVPIALCCDLRFVAEDAPLVSAFAARGLIAEWGLSWLLGRLVGPAVALDILFSSRRVLGTEAVALGLANAALPADEVLQHSQSYLRELASRVSPTSMAIMKRQVYEQLHAGLGVAEKQSQSLMRESFARSDFKEGLESFRAKRPPVFARLPKTDP